MADIAASTLAKLKMKAANQKLQLQQLLILFCQEEFLRRISRSTYNENLVLKGGLLLYTISEFASRPTIDADYLLKNYSNDMKFIKKMTHDIINIPTENDFIQFDVRNFKTIAEHRKYSGVRANLVGKIKNTRTPFSIDFGVGDIVIPPPKKRTLPVILPNFKRPKVLTYSLESIIAEKLDAIISLMETTGRMKDFYDIYYLAITFDFDGRKLQEAIYETLSNRGTPYEKDSVQVIKRLGNNSSIITRWNNFCKKVLKKDLEFQEVLQVIIDFLAPPFLAIVKETEFFGQWASQTKSYKQ